MITHLLKKIIATMVLLLVTTGVWASEDLVQTRNVWGVPTTLDVTYNLMKSYNDWDKLFDTYANIRTNNTTVTRERPYIDLEVLLKKYGILNNSKNQTVVSTVYVEWNERWHNIGTITSYVDDWHFNFYSMSRDQFYKTKNDPAMNQEYGSFFTIMFTNEQRLADMMPFYYIPSARMIEEANGKRMNFRLKIENNPTEYRDNIGYSVSYVIDCELNYKKAESFTLKHSSLDEVKLTFGSQYLFNLNNCTALQSFRDKVSNSFTYYGQIMGNNVNRGFSGNQANSTVTIPYPLKSWGLCDFWTWCSAKETFYVKADDFAKVVYSGGKHYYQGITKDLGFTVSWPRVERTMQIRLHDDTPPFGYTDVSTGTINVTWNNPKSETDSYVFVFRAESPEDSETAEADLENANWKFVRYSYMGSGRKFDVEDKVNAYNKRYTYAFLQLPFVGADHVDFDPYREDTDKLPKGLVVATTQVTTTPGITIDMVQDKTVTDKIAIKITPSKLPLKETKQNYDVFRRTEGEEEWKKLETISITNDGKTTYTYTDKTVDGCTVYEYKVNTYAKNEDVGLDNLLEGEPVRMSVLERSHVTKLDVSKGDRESSVMITWQAKQIGKTVTTYYVQRRPVNSNEEYVTIHTVKGTADRYSYEDKGVDAGQYYDYRVEAYTEDCHTASRALLVPGASSTEPESATHALLVPGASSAGFQSDGSRRAAADTPDLTYSNSEGETGFCMSKGIISGRVSYGTGSSVEGVKILLTPQTDDQNVKIVSHSQKINNGGSISWTTTGKEMKALASHEQPFTLQFYVHPQPGLTNQPIVTIPGLSSLYVTSNDSTASLKLGSQSFSQMISATQYSHLTIAIDGNTAMLTANGDTIHTETITLPGNTWNDTYADKDEVNLRLGGELFQGHVRELRLWTRVLTPQEIMTTYNRTLSGMETGLAIYWPLDEGLVRHAFDISCTGGVKNQRHPAIDVNVKPDTWVPTEKQLSLYGLTNKNGEYTIRGVPFTGTGTNYTITPQMPLHEFMPTTLNGFVSKQSLSLNNNDFRDQSSFEYRGTVSYMNTDIPVDSVTFEIDGNTVMIDKKPVMTDANGQFTISVPIGSHAIQAVRSDHVLSRYPETGTVEFKEAGVINFTDSTLVNVAGRINGGADNDTIPLGFRMSTNRIGVATMTLCLEKEANNRFNLNADRSPSGKQTPILPSGDNMKSHSYYPADAPTDIVIQTDPKTGEFSAMLPPLRYIIKSIKFPDGVPYNDEKFFRDNLPAIDARMKSVNCADTLVTEEGKQQYETQGRLLLTYRRDPTIVVGQSGMPLDAFGSYDIEDPEDEEKYICLIDTVTAAEAEANPNLQEGDFKNYRFTDRPVFEQGRRYTVKIFAEEQYDYYDTDGTLAKTYTMLPPDGIIHINNSLSSQAIVADSTLTYNGQTYHPGDRLQVNTIDISLPEEGAVVYSWICGAPNFNGDRTIPLTINLEANKKLTLWEGALPQKDGALRGYVVGSLLTGTRFLTKGPDRPTFVLRDPGGAQSTATLQNDTIYTDYENDTHSWGGAEKFIWTLTAGTYVKFRAGFIAAGVLTDAVNEYDGRFKTKIGEAGKFLRIHNESDAITNTYSEKVTTGSDGAHCGRMGDTYLGVSTNIYYGEGRYLKFKKKSDGSLFLTDSTGITSAMELATSYNYSEYHLKKNVLPEWERLRNQMLEHVETWNDVPSPAQIRDGRAHYYTIYQKGDAKYGTTNPGNFKDYLWASDLGKPKKTSDASYIMVIPDELTHYVDTISTFNANITNWRNIIAMNEDDKIAAIAKGGGENLSFSGGNSITKSRSNVTSDYQNNNWGFTRMNTFDFGVRYKFSHEVNKVGYTLEGEAKAIREIGHKKYKTIDKKNTISYTLADNNYLAALSISVYDSPAGWGPIFITEGGQTMCPYEAGTKCEYSETNFGKELDKATMRIEKCDLSVENANVSDVPSGSTAIFNIHLYNNSETQSPSNYTIIPHPSNNLNGGNLMLDGEPIPSTGITYFLPYGDYKKTLTLKQGDLSVTDFQFMIRMQSSSDTTRIFSGWKTLTAHFVPTSAPVEIESDLAVINSQTDSATITLRNLDRNFHGLKGVRLQYRRQGTDTWTLAQTWINEQYRKEYPTALSFPAEGNLTQRMLFMADGTYELRAQTFSLFGTSDVVKESEVITLVQDRKKPQALSVTDISNYLSLTNRDEVHLTFNEPIRKEAISQAANVRIVEVVDDQGNTPVSPHVVDEADYSLVFSDNDIYFTFRDAILPKMHKRIYKFSVFDVPDQYGNPSDTISWLMQCNFSSVYIIPSAENITLEKGQTEILSFYTVSVEDGHTFTLSGQPSWIKLSDTQGVTSENMENIEVTILPAAPIGKHEVNIYVTEANGISKAITLHITVEGNKPNWTVDSEQFENNMVIVGRLKTDAGEWSTNDHLLIGAFDEFGICRGVTYTDFVLNKTQGNTQITETGFANLMIYGNKNNEPLTFRIYDETTGFIYQNVQLTLPNGQTVTTLNFTSDEMLGSYEEPVAFKTGNQLMQNLELLRGWNWVSFYLDSDKTIDELLGSHAYAIGCIKTKEQFSDNYYSEADKRYRFAGDLASQKIKKGIMYKIYSLYDVQIPVPGNKPADKWQLTLTPGWNWIGVPYHNVLSLEEMFGQPLFDDYVKDRFHSAIFNERSEWEGTLKAVLPGNGYIYRSMADSAVTVSESRRAAEPAAVNTSDYSDNMTIVMQPLKGDDLMPNTEVSVYIGGTLRGKATTNSQGLCYLTIAGNQSDIEGEMTVRVGNAEVIVPQDIWYSNDAIIGHTSDPYVLQLVIPDIASR